MGHLKCPKCEETSSLVWTTVTVDTPEVSMVVDCLHKKVKLSSEVSGTTVITRCDVYTDLEPPGPPTNE